MLKQEIRRKKAKPAYYEALANTLGFKQIMELTHEAVKNDNPDALMALTRSNVHAVAAALDPETAFQFFRKKLEDAQSQFLPEFYFMLRSAAPKRLRIMLRRMARAMILKSSIQLSGQGLRGGTRFRVVYRPGLPEFDFESSLPALISLRPGDPPAFHYFDLVGFERRKVKKHVVLILDTSGSMFGKLLLNAAMTTSTLSYILNRDHTAVILFASDAYVLKGINKKKELVTLIDEILDAEAVGFTNITKGLARGLQELQHVKGTKKFGILITDGNYNRGDNPTRIARKFPTLHVIGVPAPKQTQGGQSVCRAIAASGKGNYIPVHELHEIPRALNKLLRRT
jgi:Mg-chelatase subunit ChlD